MYIDIDPTKTALVIVCPDCDSSYVIREPREEALNPGETVRCFNCNTALIGSRKDEEGHRVIDQYRHLLESIHKKKERGRMMLRVPVEEKMARRT